MAEIQVAPLSEHLSDQEIVDLAAALERAGAPILPHANEADALPVDEDIDERALEDLMDRLEAHDMSCNLYLPVEFDGRVECGELRVASTQNLVDALEDLRDDLGLEEDFEESEEEEETYDDAEQQEGLRACWRTLYDAAHEAAKRHLPLHVRG